MTGLAEFTAAGGRKRPVSRTRSAGGKPPLLQSRCGWRHPWRPPTSATVESCPTSCGPTSLRCPSISNARRLRFSVAFDDCPTGGQPAANPCMRNHSQLLKVRPQSSDSRPAPSGPRLPIRWTSPARTTKELKSQCLGAATDLTERISRVRVWSSVVQRHHGLV